MKRTFNLESKFTNFDSCSMDGKRTICFFVSYKSAGESWGDSFDRLVGLGISRQSNGDFYWIF